MDYDNYIKLETFRFAGTDLHKLDEWKTLIKQDMSSCVWMESDSDDSSDSDDDDDDDEDDSDDDDSGDDSSEMDTD